MISFPSLAGMTSQPSTQSPTGPDSTDLDRSAAHTPAAQTPPAARHLVTTAACRPVPDAEITPTRPGPGRSAAVQRWMQEWQTWQDRPTTATALARWQRFPCLAELGVPEGPGSLEAVLAACGRDVTVPQDVADLRLAAVVAEALTGDQVATRLVLQRVFPALVQRAAARARLHQLAFGTVLDDLLAQAWLVISQYPLQTRPAKIAVNIIRDAEYRLFGYVPITQRNTLPVAPEHLLTTSHKSSPIGAPVNGPERVLSELPVMLLDEVSAGFPLEDARLLTQVYLLGLSTAEIAAAEQVSARWVRARKQRALARLAAHLGYPHPPAPAPRTTSGGRSGRRQPAVASGDAA